MNARRFQLITFDLDDTLWDARPVLFAAEQRVSAWIATYCPELFEHFDRAGLIELRGQLLRDRQDLSHQISTLRIETMRVALLRSGFAEADAKSLADTAFQVFIEARHEVKLFAAVEETLAELHSNYLLAALTNGNADIFRLDLGKYFSFAFRAEELDASKPDPRHFLTALRTANVGPERMIHIGDHPGQDIEPAQRLGITTIWFNPEQREWTGVTPLPPQISGFGALPKVIAMLEQGQVLP